MKLVVFPLNVSRYQVMVPSKHTLVAAVRPHLYIHNHPTGTLKVVIRASDGTLVAESDEMDIEDIPRTEDYYHGYVRFYVDAFLKKDVEYRFYVAAGGSYAFDEDDYVGVCNDYDLIKYDTTFEVPSNYVRPLDLELWEKTLK